MTVTFTHTFLPQMLRCHINFECYAPENFKMWAGEAEKWAATVLISRKYTLFKEILDFLCASIAMAAKQSCIHPINM